jgi:hypothetical protein
MTFAKIRNIVGRLLMSLGKEVLPSSEAKRKKSNGRLDQLKNLWFLADAPLFIDSSFVNRLYDSIFRPEYEITTRTRSQGNSRSQELASELGSTGEISIPTIFKISATSKISGRSIGTTEQSESLTEMAVQSPERRLEKLINLYVYSYPERLFQISSDLVSIKDMSGKECTSEEMDQSLDKEGIRPLVILDLHAKSRIIPMAAESVDGKVLELYEALIAVVDPPKKIVPQYPVFGSQGFENNKRAYWKALDSVFNSTCAMRVVEKSSRDSGRLDWIDFRWIGFRDEDVFPFHLHVAPRGQYSTGTFAYQLIRRTEKHGTRILGSLKKGEDINVVAIYER